MFNTRISISEAITILIHTAAVAGGYYLVGFILTLLLTSPVSLLIGMLFLNLVHVLYYFTTLYLKIFGWILAKVKSIGDWLQSKPAYQKAKSYVSRAIQYVASTRIAQYTAQAYSYVVSKISQAKDYVVNKFVSAKEYISDKYQTLKFRVMNNPTVVNVKSFFSGVYGTVSDAVIIVNNFVVNTAITVKTFFVNTFNKIKSWFAKKPATESTIETVNAEIIVA